MVKDDRAAITELNGNLQEFEQFLVGSLTDLFGDNASMCNPSMINSKSKVNRQSSLKVLDFKKLKVELANSKDINYTCAVLEALRWRVSKAGSIIQRREVVIQFSNYDLIDYTFFTTLLEKKSRLVTEHIIALANSVASDYLGRSYLIENEQLITHLVYILKNEDKETFIRKNCLGILQKLSLRKKPQEILISNDIIKWVVNTLNNEKESLSDYTLEYLTALLLNLSLRTIGKDKLEEIKFKALNLLLDLLEHPNVDLQSYVNGTLYSLFTRQSIKKLALEMGFDSKLRDLIADADEELQKRYEYVLAQLLSSGDDSNMSELNEDEHDVDLTEDEDLASDEEAENAPNVVYDVHGEAILQTFKLEGDEADKVS